MGLIDNLSIHNACWVNLMGSVIDSLV